MGSKHIIRGTSGQTPDDSMALKVTEEAIKDLLLVKDSIVSRMHDKASKNSEDIKFIGKLADEAEPSEGRLDGGAITSTIREKPVSQGLFEGASVPPKLSHDTPSLPIKILKRHNSSPGLSFNENLLLYKSQIDDNIISQPILIHNNKKSDDALLQDNRDFPSTKENSIGKGTAVLNINNTLEKQDSKDSGSPQKVKDNIAKKLEVIIEKLVKKTPEYSARFEKDDLEEDRSYQGRVLRSHKTKNKSCQQYPGM